MKICIFNPNPLTTWGGGERIAYWLSNGLVKNGHEVTLLCHPYDVQERVSLKDLEINFRCKEIDVSRIVPLTKNVSLIDYVNERLKGFDVYLINGLLKRSFFPMFSLKMARHHPSILHINSHSDIHPAIRQGRGKILGYYHRYMHLPQLIRRVDALWVLNRAHEEFAKHNKKRVYRIENPVNCKEFRPMSKNDRFTVLFVGRLCYQKGLETLFEAIGVLNGNKLPVDFVLIGTGDQKYEHAIRGIESKYPNIHWKKFLSEDKLIENYAKSHILVLPSRWEGLPIVVLEAYACGTPAVASNIPGSQDVVLARTRNFANHNRCTGALYPLINVKALVDEIKAWFKLWEYDTEIYEKICRNARTYAINEFSEEKILSKIEGMLFQVCA